MTVDQLAETAKELRKMSKNCKVHNGAIMLQAVAAWLERREIFEPPAELWEHADRLCSCPHCKTCGGLIITLDEKTTLCGCPVKCTYVFPDYPTADFALRR